jgi:hypothetical protein
MVQYKKLKELIQDASDLVQADRRVVKAVIESDFENLPTLLSEFRNKKLKVQAGLSSQPAVEGVDDSTRELLARVQRKFPTDNVIEEIERADGEELSFYDLSEEEISTLGSDLPLPRCSISPKNLDATVTGCPICLFL